MRHSRPMTDAAMSWSDAHRAAQIAAAQAHHDLGIDPSQGWVDIAASIASANTLLFWRPLPRVFGAYINEPGARPGIIVNSRLSPAVRRYTAAHELGHHWFGHATRIDDDGTIQEALTDDQGVVGPRSTRRGWPAEEKIAESFAAWFLIPRQAALSGLRQLGLVRPASAGDVYQLSLLLGAPYRATARHLPNIRLATSTQARTWMTVPPSRLKAAVDAQAPPPTTRAGAVWALGSKMDGTTVTLYPGDRVVVAAAMDDVYPPETLAVVPLRAGASGGNAVLCCMPGGAGDVEELVVMAPSGQPPWRVNIRRATTPSGVDEHWTLREEHGFGHR